MAMDEVYVQHVQGCAASAWPALLTDPLRAADVDADDVPDVLDAIAAREATLSAEHATLATLRAMLKARLAEAGHRRTRARQRRRTPDVPRGRRAAGVTVRHPISACEEDAG
jgi:hypothetical protein